MERGPGGEARPAPRQNRRCGTMNEQLLAMPQWTTGARLLALGEAIDFRFFLPAGVPASDLTIFPQYLERANPGAAFVAGDDLAWLDSLDSEQHAPVLCRRPGHADLSADRARQLPRSLAGRRRTVLPLLLGPSRTTGSSSASAPTADSRSRRPCTPPVFRSTTACPLSISTRPIRSSGGYALTTATSATW